MKLIWNSGIGLIDNGCSTWNVAEAPALPFDFLGLFYNDQNGTALRLSATGQEYLTPDEIAIVREYIVTQMPPVPIVNIPGVSASLIAAIQSFLDETARTRGYDNMLTLCTYLHSTVPKFANEARIALEWRDAVWSAANAALDAFANGKRDGLTPEALISELPGVMW